MHNEDSRGHAITTESEAAAKHIVTAFDSYGKRRTDTMPQLASALEADPNCALAHAAFGLLLQGAKHQDFQPKITDALHKAQQGYATASLREQRYIDALSFATQGQLNKVVTCYEAILDDHPTDLFALSLCQSELFWLGDMPKAETISAKTESHWHQAIPGYGEFLAVRAFDLEEAGKFAAAEAAGREAVDIDASNIWATHAVTHVMHMQARFDEGIEWISGLQNQWDDLNQIKLHVWWHKALFHLERGETDAVLEAYDNWIRNRSLKLVESMPDLYIDLQNGASLLWRLEHNGIDVKHRWQEMATLVKNRVQDMGSPFTSAHYAIILAAVGDFEHCDRLIDNMQDFIKTSDQTLTHNFSKIALPAAQAAIAHRKGDYQLAVDKLMPVRHSMELMGGSHAQQDLFFQILVDAAYQLQRTDLISTLMHEIEMIGFIEPTQRSAYKVAASL